jgi:predicted CXXCH cytochrome family protein
MNLLKFTTLLFLFFCVLSVPFSCYYDNEEELYGTQTGVCDTAAVKYSTFIKPLMENNCTSCHSATGTQPDYVLDTYDAVKISATDGALVLRTNDVDSPMPQSGLLPACDRLKIEAWVKAGAPNN